MTVQNFLKLFLGAQNIMTNDDLSSAMTCVQRTFNLVVQTAQIILNVPLTALFLYENINTTLKSLGKRGGS